MNKKFHNVTRDGIIGLLAGKSALTGCGKIVVFSGPRPKTGAKITSDVFTYVLPGLAEPETRMMIDSIFEFQCLTQRVFEMIQLFPVIQYLF
ncbi:MAG: hypothetical protein PHW04_07010 [Candidatus Wallbacteria bacterium]|nr:hypothetical protein [Candidatus Wallbacteria bacterium]